MIKVSKLIEELKKFPPDADAYAYEGEVVGVVVVNEDKELGWIPASERMQIENDAIIGKGV